jgi:hypothetical protein
MNFKFYILIIFVALGCAHESPRQPSSSLTTKYGTKALPLSLYHESLSTLGDPFWKIIPYYRAQATNASCSIASVTMIINALIPSYTLNAETKLFTEQSLLKLSNSKRWKKAVSSDGKGMSLKDLATEINNLLPKLGLSNFKADFREMLSEVDATAFQEALLKQMKGEGWIILNYDQGLVMGSGSYGHFSPVASYWSQKNKVLILDTDATWYEPYWVGINTLTNSMKTFDNDLNQARGFIWIFKTKESDR